MQAREKFWQAQACPDSTVKTRAQLGLQKFGLVPPLTKPKFFIKTFTCHLNSAGTGPGPILGPLYNSLMGLIFFKPPCFKAQLD